MDEFEKPLHRTHFRRTYDAHCEEASSLLDGRAPPQRVRWMVPSEKVVEDGTDMEGKQEGQGQGRQRQRMRFKIFTGHQSYFVTDF